MTVSSPYEHQSYVRVRYAETDQMGVVYHSNYLIWCEIGRTDYIRSLGRSYADIERDGITLAVSSAEIRYLGSARYDDEIVVKTTVTDVKSRSVTFSYTVCNVETGKTLVTANTSLVALNSDGRPSRMPESLQTMLASGRAEL